MREYEMVFIVRSDLDENALNELVEKVKGWISEPGGQVTKVDLWGKRRLAYPIRKQIEGHYVLMNMKMSPQIGRELERNLRFLDPVIRYLILTN